MKKATLDVYGKGKDVVPDGNIRGSTFKFLKEENWKPHPLVKESVINLVLSKAENDADITCMFGKVPKGTDIPEHFHELSNDIMVPLEGKAKIWVNGAGEFEMRKGVIINIPKGVKHRVFDVEEDLLVFVIYTPGLKWDVSL